jgi:hypothetical protein
MMFSPKEIMLLNLIFSSSLGIVALGLFMAMLKRQALPPREPLFLCIRKDNILFRRVPVKRGRYLIGRGSECDILLEGTGIPVIAGELFAAQKLFFKNVAEYPVIKNNFATPPEFEIMPGDEVRLYDYCVTLENA